MKKYIKILVLLAFIIFLNSGCQITDYSEINKTYKPKLELAPVNGKWEVENVVVRNGKFSFEIGDKLYLDVKLFATENKIFLNPDFEVMRVNLKKYLSSRKFESNAIQEISDDQINVIEIIKDKQIVGEIIPIDRNKMFLNIENELVTIKRLTSRLEDEEIENLKAAYSEEKKVYDGGSNWSISLGIRSINQASNISQGNNISYNSLILKNSDGQIITNFANGIVIKGDNEVNIYDVHRREVEGKFVDKIFLNNDEISINNINRSNQNGLFRIVYASNKYISLEYFGTGNDVNTFSTYSADSKLELQQQKIDDITDYSYDKVLDIIRATDSKATFTDSIYNIAFSRENGFTVLKGRIPFTASSEQYNRDYVVSTQFNSNEQIYPRLDIKELQKIFPNMIDALATPSNDYVIVVSKDAISLYKIDLTNRNYKQVYEKKFENSFSIVSMSWFQGGEINLLNSSLLIGTKFK